jgi:hypothetical protein
MAMSAISKIEKISTDREIIRNAIDAKSIPMMYPLIIFGFVTLYLLFLDFLPHIIKDMDKDKPK